VVGAVALEGVDSGSRHAAPARLKRENVQVEAVPAKTAQRPAHRRLCVLVQDQLRLRHLQLSSAQRLSRVVQVHHTEHVSLHLAQLRFARDAPHLHPAQKTQTNRFNYTKFWYLVIFCFNFRGKIFTFRDESVPCNSKENWGLL